MRRAGALAACAALFSVLIALVVTIGCTSTHAIPPGDIYRNGPLKGVYLITTRDGRSVMTDRAVASDSTIIVGAILINAKRTVIPPMSIAYTDIVAIKKKKTNVLATVAVCGSIVAACWGIVSALGNFGPIGQ